MKKTARTACVLMCLLIACTTGYSQQATAGYSHLAIAANMTPLMAAASMDKLDIVRGLVGNGNGLDIIDARDKLGRTPLIEAACKGHLDVVQYLVEKGADVNAKDSVGLTPLTWAICQGHLDVVKYLVAKGADVNTMNNDGKTALMWAVQMAKTGLPNVVELLKQHGAK